MGFSYVIVMALVIVACICITIYVLSIILPPYMNLISSYSDFVVTSYYLSSKFIEVSIKNVGSMPIVSINITVVNTTGADILNINFGQDNFEIPRQVSVSCSCIFSSSWYCECIPSTAVNTSSSLYACTPSSSSISEHLCTIEIANDKPLTPGYVYRIYIYVKFKNGLIKARSLSMVASS